VGRSRGAIIRYVGESEGTAVSKSSEPRELRRDAAANRDRVLTAAAAAVRREGAGVPLATIAAEAGVGVGTLYRRYPSREALLAALTRRSFRLVLDAAHRAADSNHSAIECLRSFIDQTVDHGADLVLPMHGGPVPLDQETIALRTEVHDNLEQILRRGRQDGTIRSDVTALDIIVFGAMLAQPLPHVPDWKMMARRQAIIYLHGLGGTAVVEPEHELDGHGHRIRTETAPSGKVRPELGSGPGRQ
jgi:AcrR family transcriptional regulator